VFLVAFAAAIASADNESPRIGTVIDGSLGQRLDAAVQAQDAKPFWGAILVARDGKIVLAKGYGLADLKAIPNTPQMLFDIGSASKPFTAAAILKLEEQGKLKTADSITQYLEEVPKDKAAVTIQHLLTHTSGISGDIDFTGVMLRDREPMTAAVLKAPLRSVPGQAFQYANPNYFLLAAIIERASGQKFESYIKEQVLVPAGMTNTYFLQDPNVDRALETQRVLRPGTNGEAPLTDRASWFAWSWGFRGATGIVTSADDLFRWDEALRGDKILGKQAKEKFFRPDKAGYACGWQIGQAVDGSAIVGHGGATRGYRTELARYPKHNALIVVLTDESTDPRAIQHRLEAVLIAGSDKGSIEAKQSDHGPKADIAEAVFKNYHDLKWDKILPDLGPNSPEICVLHVDPKTKATKLLIRTPAGIHIRKHWHSANETHTMIVGAATFACDGKRIEQGPGSFNYLPAKMHHEAWTTAGSVVFITVDGPWDVNWAEGAPTAADLTK
jgi:CubicO group peptidase (beta-lactamase class C family)/mannose-6-phosphate isomerase-like protein (cupin superfamily)